MDYFRYSPNFECKVEPSKAVFPYKSLFGRGMVETVALTANQDKHIRTPDNFLKGIADSAEDSKPHNWLDRHKETCKTRRMLSILE